MTQPPGADDDLEALIARLSQSATGEPAIPSESPDGRAGDAEDGAAGEEDSPGPAFGDVGAFVEDYLRVVIERRLATGPTSGVRWCIRWWAHPEALGRIYALWRAWETLRLDPGTGMSVWWRDHLDPHLSGLCAEYGPFSQCTPERHKPAEPLPTEPVPEHVLAQLPDHHANDHRSAVEQAAYEPADAAG